MGMRDAAGNAAGLRARCSTPLSITPILRYLSPQATRRGFGRCRYYRRATRTPHRPLSSVRTYTCTHIHTHMHMHMHMHFTYAYAYAYTHYICICICMYTLHMHMHARITYMQACTAAPACTARIQSERRGAPSRVHAYMHMHMCVQAGRRAHSSSQRRERRHSWARG